MKPSYTEMKLEIIKTMKLVESNQISPEEGAMKVISIQEAIIAYMQNQLRAAKRA